MNKQASLSPVYFNINQVAKQISVTAATIRNWENAGLFVSKRSKSNYRIFDYDDISFLEKIKKYSIDQGMKLSHIKKMLTNEESICSTTQKNTQAKNIYEKTKHYRGKNQYTLKQVSEVTHISLSYLSRIELGQVQPSLEILKKLAEFYGESILTFLDVNNINSSPLVKKNEAITFNSHLKGVSNILLGGNENNIFSVVLFIAEETAGDFTSHSHSSGHDLVYLVSGSLHFTLDDKEEYNIEEGDCIHFDSTRMHKWHNTAKGTTQFLWVHTSL